MDPLTLLPAGVDRIVEGGGKCGDRHGYEVVEVRGKCRGECRDQVIEVAEGVAARPIPNPRQTVICKSQRLISHRSKASGLPVFVEGLVSTSDLAPYCHLLRRNEGSKRQRELASSFHKGAIPFLRVLAFRCNHCFPLSRRMNFLKHELRRDTSIHTKSREDQGCEVRGREMEEEEDDEGEVVP